MRGAPWTSGDSPCHERSTRSRPARQDSTCGDCCAGLSETENREVGVSTTASPLAGRPRPWSRVHEHDRARGFKLCEQARGELSRVGGAEGSRTSFVMARHASSAGALSGLCGCEPRRFWSGCVIWSSTRRLQARSGTSGRRAEGLRREQPVATTGSTYFKAASPQRNVERALRAAGGQPRRPRPTTFERGPAKPHTGAKALNGSETRGSPSC